MRSWYMLVAPMLVLAGLSAAPTAAAECTTSDNMTLCSLGDGDGDFPTLPAPSGFRDNRMPGYSYGPSNNYNYYFDDGYKWFQP